MKNEIWKDVVGYEGIYQVSNLGDVKSLPRLMQKGKNIFTCKEKILKHNIKSNGYSAVVLCLNKIKKTMGIHQLVAMAFLNHTPCGHKLVIDHRNDNKLDNRLENLQVVTNRFNTCKTQGMYSSKYKGVSWHEGAKKWTTKIQINRKSQYLGLFNCELAASQAYQNKLKEII